MIDTLVVLGGLGDLASRYLLPAMAELAVAGHGYPEMRVLAVDRADLDSAAFREHASKALEEHATGVSHEAREELCRRLDYARADVTDPADLEAALSGVTEPAIVYLALPNTVFRDVIRALPDTVTRGAGRLVVEKPFGRDREDARALNELVRERFREEQVFRIDHFLAKQTVLNVLGLRFANRLFEPVWNNQHVQAVDITWFEDGAVDGRAGYYDTAGALRDMVQNHLLQLLALVAMEPPSSLHEQDLRDRKADVLRAVRAPGTDEPANIRRARYTAGRTASGDHTPAYADQAGVDPDRMTETYAEVTVAVDNWRWSGVPFRLRTGKALGEATQEILIRFRTTAHQPFDEAAPADVLRFALDPDRIEVELNINGPGHPLELQREQLVAGFSAQDLRPYSLLLQEIFEGDPTLSIRGDEAEECWRVVEPVLTAFAEGTVPLEEYPAGSDGPGSA